MKKDLFGKRLRELRIQKGLTQRELAERAGLHITTVANYEINRREPKANQLKALAEALGAGIDRIFTPDQAPHDGRSSQRMYLMAEVFLQTGRGPVPALSVNISRSGIGVYTEERLERGDEVTVTLRYISEGALKTSEDIPATVAWTAPIGKKYTAGIRFTRAISRMEFPELSRRMEQT